MAGTTAASHPVRIWLALVASGFAALVYEICWMRLATLSFGSTVLATSMVLAAFFAGLALGGELSGRWSLRGARPLRAFALLELALAALGAASPLAFALADSAYGRAYDALGDSPAALAALRLAILTPLVLLPATCMGAGLPLCTSALAAAARRASHTLAALYAGNTLGALAGCLACGWWLIPGLGVQRSTLVAGAANALAAALVFTLPAPPPKAVSREPAAPSGARLLGVLVFAGGAVALANEVLWMRYLGLLVHNSVMTYTLSLAVVLAGVAAGSALAPLLLRAAGRAAARYGALQVGIGLLVLATASLPPAVWQATSGYLLSYALLLAPPSLLAGAAFPLAVQLQMQHSSSAGLGVGRLYALSTLGGIAGALGAGFVLLPLAGLQLGLLATSGTSVVAGIAAWLLLAPRARALHLASVAAVGLWFAVPVLAATRVPDAFLAAGRELVDVREGISADVTVVREAGELQLEIDRWWQGSSRKNHQSVAAHLPMLLHPDPRAVLVVGAGAGQTSSRVLLYDEVERLDVVDIEPAVFAIIERHFPAGWMHDPRVHLLRDDGRNYIAHTHARYDLISLETGQISRPGVATFYTRDFYTLARAHLQPGGLLVQFVPLPFFTLPEFRNVVRTFTDVFPASVLWYNTAELLLVGRAGTAFTVDPARLLELDRHPAALEDLQYSQWGGPAEWLSQTAPRLAGFLVGPAGLAAIGAGGTIYRDDRPVLEYETAEADAAHSGEAAITAVLQGQLEPVSEVLGLGLDAQTAGETERLRAANLTDITAAAELRRMRVAAARGDASGVLAHLRAATKANPRSVLAQRLLADALVASGQGAEAHAHYALALGIDPGDFWTHRGLAHLLQQQGRYADAIGHYTQLLERHPEDAEVHNDLGAALAASGNYGAAEQHFRVALRLRPGYADAQRNLARVLAVEVKP